MRASLLLAAVCAAGVACNSDGRQASPDTAAIVIGELAGRTAKSCGSPTSLTGRGIGALTIGKRVREVAASCDIIRDTVVPGAEAVDERQIAVDLARDTAVATVEDDRIWRVEIERPVFRTSDSLGVGSTLAALLQSPSARGVEGEGQLFVLRDDHCGLSFRIAYDIPDSAHKEEWTRRQLSTLPDTARVDLVLVVGCS